MMRRYVSAFIGARDFYQLPLALREVGLLERLVTDLYTPDAIANLRFRPKQRWLRNLSNRYAAGLSSRYVQNNLSTIFRQAADPHRRNAPQKMAFLMDRSLSLGAAKIAEATDSHLFLYSGVGYWAFDRLADRQRLLFQFHPHPNFASVLLQEDVERYPEVRHSFETEYDSIPMALRPPENLVEWALASEILCASTFTKRSLVAQGCPPEKISVAPYGAPQLPEELGRPAEPNTRCQFLFVGQGVQRKGVHHLLRAWKLAALPDADLTMICWKIDPGLVPMADQANVRLSGGLSRPDLNTAYWRSDVFVLPSLVEGFGLVYQEAMAAGLHCIGTANTGLPDLNVPESVATIVQTGDIEGLATALTDVHSRWKQGGLDRDFTRAFAGQRSWSDFREDVRAFVSRARD
jgi:glycosyltransferase involved in cell wall biosynthesis